MLFFKFGCVEDPSLLSRRADISDLLSGKGVTLSVESPEAFISEKRKGDIDLIQIERI